MNLTVLGCGTGLSGGEKAGSGFLIDNGLQKIVFDLGFGTNKNLQKVIDFTKVNNIFFSHYGHMDHIADLFSFISQRSAFVKLGASKEKTQINLFGPKGFSEFVFSVFKSLSLDNFPFPVNCTDIEYFDKKIFGYRVQTKPVRHLVDTLGYRVESSGKIFAYSGDTEYCDSVVELGKEADLFVLECAFLEDEKKSGHLTANDCARIAKESGAKKILLSHLFPSTDESEAKNIVQNGFDGEVLIAKDLMELEV